MIAVLCSLLISASGKESDKVIYEERTAWGLRQVVVISAEHFDRAYLTRMAKRFVRKNRHLNVLHLRVGTSVRQAPPLPKLSEVSYEPWRASQLKLRQEEWRVAETIAFGSSAVMRIRYPDGRVERVQLQGKRDPLLRSVEETKCEVMHVANGRFIEKRMVAVYLRCEGPLTIRLGEQLLEQLKKELAVPLLRVKIRNDIWFVEDPMFPLYFVFRDESPPTEAEYAQLPIVTCNVGFDNDGCTGFGIDQ